MGNLVWALLPAMLVSGAARAVTRDVADLQPVRLSFGQSVLNQLSYGTYRDPYDELQTRPYNLLFSNIGRHAVLSPWQGQAGSYTRYLNALIGNNGAANVDNEADSIQGALIRRETPAWAWGVSAAFLAGQNGSSDSNATETFSDSDDLTGYDVRGAAAYQASDRRVLGVGIHLTQALSEITHDSFEQAVGGLNETQEVTELRVALDAGLRQFISPTSSWEARAVVQFGTAEQSDTAVDLDDTATPTGSFVSDNYDITDLGLGIHGGYNRLKAGGVGEIEFRASLEHTQRKLDNSDLQFSEAGGLVTPELTLLGDDPVTTTQLRCSAKRIFQAGETEMFSAAEVGYGMVDGSTQYDSTGTVINESVDDSQFQLGLTLGLRQPLFHDKLRFIVSGRADVLGQDRNTIFDTTSIGDDKTLSTAQYAIGLEGVLANVTFDLAWLQGDEAQVVPVPLGFPQGSRRSVNLDRLVFAAAVAW